MAVNGSETSLPKRSKTARLLYIKLNTKNVWRLYISRNLTIQKSRDEKTVERNSTTD